MYRSPHKDDYTKYSNSKRLGTVIITIITIIFNNSSNNNKQRHRPPRLSPPASSMAHKPPRRGIVAAALFFLIASIYLCVTRLYMTGSSTSSTQQLHPNPPKEIHVQLTDADLPMTYGTFRRPSMDGLTLMADLPQSLVPTPENKRRLVFVGDIHGMDAALEALLQKVNFDPSRDHLIATGDMINKGPDSPGVVARLMRLNASAVRGNHEDRILLALAEAETQTGVSKELSSPDAEAHRGEAELLAVGRKLGKEQVEWLRKLPVILAVEPLRILVAHAGLVPGVRPELQDPWAVMNMRTLVYPREEMRKKEGGKKKNKNKAKRDADEESPAEASAAPPPSSSSSPSDSQPPSPSSEPEEEQGETLESIQQKDAYADREVAIPVESRDGEKWSTAWNRFQKRLKKSHRYTVVYGHDSKRGLREDRYTFGLDSGCVKGDALTALVVEAKEGGGRGEWTHTLVQVQCKDFA
ncbi:Metallo-dependent phosphatase [Trichoderma longibrachiatum ATCC 18648]|uniref:Metallo-dependent phosphatase n=1 Tax=Trichoderma longibrachiatum ATCC 18648 TaxID=983965 RepID=A0A2T4BRJ1_TRILO|nr:Metallo-dependent phosphatase [Trichoderma longibrachiatum ATCC 18648]